MSTPQQPVPGYTDTPLIPGTRWHVHDPERPQPPAVAPGTPSTPEAAGQPPSDAIVLCDGTSLDGWVGADGGPARWNVENGYLEVVPKTGDITSRAQFGDCQLHLEWRAPAEVSDSSQGRGNSGVFLMERYEIQVLDCYQNPTYADGTTGAVYGQHPPLVNACRRPGEWQSYDIVWLAPRFDGDRLVTPAYVTVFLNGVLVQYHRPVLGPTTHKRMMPYEPHPPAASLRLQDHANPVRYRNIWYRPIAVDPT